MWFQNRRAKEKRLKKDAGRRWNNASRVGQGGDHHHKSKKGHMASGESGSSSYATQQQAMLIDQSEMGSNNSDDQLSMEETGQSSPMYGSATYMENSSDLDMHSELSYGEWCGYGCVRAQ